MTTESQDAKAVSRALCPDNKDMDSIEIETVSGNLVRTSVSSASIGSLISTLDDVISCQIGAEKVMLNG